MVCKHPAERVAANSELCRCLLARIDRDLKVQAATLDRKKLDRAWRLRKLASLWLEGRVCERCRQKIENWVYSETSSPSDVFAQGPGATSSTR